MGSTQSLSVRIEYIRQLDISEDKRAAALQLTGTSEGQRGLVQSNAGAQIRRRMDAVQSAEGHGRYRTLRIMLARHGPCDTRFRQRAERKEHSASYHPCSLRLSNLPPLVFRHDPLARWTPLANCIYLVWYNRCFLTSSGWCTQAPLSGGTRCSGDQSPTHGHLAR